MIIMTNNNDYTGENYRRTGIDCNGCISIKEDFTEMVLEMTQIGKRISYDGENYAKRVNSYVVDLAAETCLEF